MKTARNFGRGVVAALITGALGCGSLAAWASAQEDAEDVRD